ncbi:MAG: hypothetical protein JW893_07930 [Candidatus Omnitrophica bacterium]|nr:hypothetical protein [Candidatus Omnitrophota bacterium]
MGEKKKRSLKFKYVIPDNLRDLHVNGAWGGITPKKELHIQFYCERNPIPNYIEHEITPDQKLGEILEKNLGGDVVRIIQTSIIMDLDTAKTFNQFINDLIQKAEHDLQVSGVAKTENEGSK